MIIGIFLLLVLLAVLDYFKTRRKERTGNTQTATAQFAAPAAGQPSKQPQQTSGPLAGVLQLQVRGCMQKALDQVGLNTYSPAGGAGSANTNPAPVASLGEGARNTLLLDRNTIQKPGERFRCNVFTPHVQQFDAHMRRLLVGQNEAIDAFREVVQVTEAGLAMPGKPLSNLLFLGPTGSGKTKAMEAAAEVITGSDTNLIRVDCAEFQHSHEIAKLIGSPPGYLGHRETRAVFDNNRLSELRRLSGRYDAVIVIFDEIEKASDALWNLLLGILDKASLTLGNNERVVFSRCVVGMTSNLGARDLVETAQFGFVKPALSARAKTDIGVGAARKKFSPEFFNRLDRVVTFGTLGQAELSIILGLEMAKVAERINKLFPALRFFYTPSLEAHLIEEGFDQRYGARPLKRTIHRNVVMPLSGLLSSGQITQQPATILIDYDETEGQVFFSDYSVKER